MNDVVAIRYLLSQNTALLAVVPAAKIMAGALPLGIVLPAIAVNHISTTERNNVEMKSAKVLATSRVQVTVQAKSYAEQKSILELVRKACPNTHATVNGVQVDSILPDIAGPDMRNDDLGIYMQSRDFIIKFLEST